MKFTLKAKIVSSLLLAAIIPMITLGIMSFVESKRALNRVI